MGFPDTFLDNTPLGVIHPPVHPLSLTALATLNIELFMGDPSPRLTNILCRILPTPTLTSTIIEYSVWSSVEYCLQGRWADVDRWLARMAGNIRVQEGLSATLIRWPRGESVPEGFLREFRKAGGKIKTDSARQWFG